MAEKKIALMTGANKGIGFEISLALATLADDGPKGGFFHMGEILPW